MILLLSLPIWVIFLDFLLKPNYKDQKNVKVFMFLCSVALIFILGLRSRYTGSRDTDTYLMAFESTKIGLSGTLFDGGKSDYDGNILFSEAGFSFYTRLMAYILPNAQSFLLLTTAIIIASISNFIKKNSEDYVLSWIAFICLGSMTFIMNGMRQALAMAICLWSYEFVKKKKFTPFFLIVLIAMLFHKSSILFIVVYFMKNLKLTVKSMSFLALASAFFLAFAGRIATIYDSLTGEDYGGNESFDGGGEVTVLIYVGVILMTLLFSKRLKEPKVFVPFALTITGLVIYFGRYISTQIYERMSYYFFYFLILLPSFVFNDLKPKEKSICKLCFVALSIVLFVYRIGKGAFSDFTLCF